MTGGFADKRLSREWKTIEAMINCYCRGRHDRPPAYARNAGNFWIMPGYDWNAAGLAWKSPHAPIVRSTATSVRGGSRSKW